jgi:UDP-N-acetylmuramate dehydrogenase
LEAYHLQEKKVHTFTAADCEFGYRDSVFKNRYKDQFAILSVTFRFRKKPIFHVSYGAITEELEKMGVTGAQYKGRFASSNKYSKLQTTRPRKNC